MDLDKFRKSVFDPARSCADLKTMFENARARNAPEYVAVAREALDRRCPGWDSVSHRRAGANPTIATYLSDKKRFPTTKEAFVWLVERFLGQAPDILSGPSAMAAKLVTGSKRRYFARHAKELFPGSPHLADDRNNFEQLSNGWLLIVNLSNAQKFEILSRLAALTKLEFPRDWNLEPDEPTQALKYRQEIQDIVEWIGRELSL